MLGHALNLVGFGQEKVSALAPGLRVRDFDRKSMQQGWIPRSFTGAGWEGPVKIHYFGVVWNERWKKDEFEQKMAKLRAKISEFVQNLSQYATEFINLREENEHLCRLFCRFHQAR